MSSTEKISTKSYKDEVMVCEFCEKTADVRCGAVYGCTRCDSYKGIKSIADWEAETGRKFPF
jgi:hypothetical protein